MDSGITSAASWNGAGMNDDIIPLLKVYEYLCGASDEALHRVARHALPASLRQHHRPVRPWGPYLSLRLLPGIATIPPTDYSQPPVKPARRKPATTGGQRLMMFHINPVR